MPHLSKLLATVAIVAAMTGTAMADEAPKNLTVDTVLATVDGTDVTFGQMLAVRSSLPPQYMSLPDETLFNGILDQLIQQTALSKIGEKNKSARDDIALEVDRRAYFSGRVLDGIARDAASDDAVKAAYDEKYAKVAPVTEYHAAHIIVPTEDEAKAIKADIDGGKDFAEEAKAKSQDGAASNGGDLGWFTPDRMVKPFADAVAKMKAGEVAGPVQTEYGWHVIKLIEDRPAKAPSIDEVRDQISAELSQAAVESAVAKAISDAKVVKSVDGIDPSVLKNDSILGN